jgi:hypothetical protein
MIPLFTSTLRSSTRLSQVQLYTTMTSVSIPKTMKGIQMMNIGGPEVLQYKTDLPVPVPRVGEVLVKNNFIGINYVDVFVAILPFLNLYTSIS